MVVYGVSNLPGRKSVASPPSKVPDATDKGVKRDLSDPKEFLEWLKPRGPLSWEILHIKKYKKGGVPLEDLFYGRKALFYVVDSDEGYSIQIDRTNGLFKVFDVVTGELPDGIDAGEFHVVLL